MTFNPSSNVALAEANASAIHSSTPRREVLDVSAKNVTFPRKIISDKKLRGNEQVRIMVIAGAKIKLKISSRTNV